jgi:hypothetical protein
MKEKNNIFSKYLVLSSFIVLFIAYGINQIFSLPPKEDIQVAIHNPNLSYDEKMALKLGYDVYYFFKFIAQNTPENSTIYVPPMMYPWPYIGNVGYASYFLYPRTLVNGNLDDTAIPIEAEYAIVIWSEVPSDPNCQICGWPKVKFNDSEIKYYKQSPQWGIAKLN